MKKRLKVVLLADGSAVPAEDPGLTTETTSTSTEFHVAAALRELGHDLTVLPVRESVEQLVRQLAEAQPDLVFNLTEEFRGNRRQDRNLAALLELMRIPFTGTGPAGLSLCRDKGLCKEILGARRIRVPGFAVVPPGRRARMPRGFRYPAVVKPLYGDGSDGISNASVVHDEERMLNRVQFVHERWNQPAIVEEYVEGRELYVSVIGNHRLAVLPPREVLFDRPNDDKPFISTYYAKWNTEYQKRWNIRFDYAEVDDRAFQKIARACKKAFRLLQIRDYGRIDLRLTPDQRVVVLEANPNPDIAYGEEVAEAAQKAGIPYNSLIQRILRYAWQRR